MCDLRHRVSCCYLQVIFLQTIKSRARLKGMRPQTAPSLHAHRMPSCFVLHTSPTLCAAGYCLKMSDVNRNTVHQNSVMHFLCIRTHPADRNREGSTWEGEVSGRSACWSSTMWLKRMAVKGPGGEGQNAQMQDCYVFYHENGTTLAINYWWTGDDG